VAATRSRLFFAVAGAFAAAELAVRLLRPRSGIVEPLPVSAESAFDAAELARARRFRRPQLALHGASALVQAGVLAALVRRPPRRGRRAAPGLALPAAAVGGALLALALELATLPLAAAARRRSIAAGLTTDTWSQWAADRAKASGIGTVFAGGGAALGVGLMGRSPQRWWVPASAAAVLTGAGMSYAGPLLLDPLFNTFTVLPDGPLRSDVLELAGRAGVGVGEVFTVDASRRTTAANAYVTGLGPTKRVVLYDTLLEHFSPDETRLVIAHELAHVRHRDVARGFLFLALTAPASLHAVARLTERLGGGGRRPGPSTLPALTLALALVSAPVGVISRRLSRRVEARADAFALGLTGAPEASISFERRIAVRNLIDPDPPAWVRALLGTHPSTLERIGIARAYKRAHGPGGDAQKNEPIRS
jgi:STE24 endopeptidase